MRNASGISHANQQCLQTKRHVLLQQAELKRGHVTWLGANLLSQPSKQSCEVAHSMFVKYLQLRSRVLDYTILKNNQDELSDVMEGFYR